MQRESWNNSFDDVSQHSSAATTTPKQKSRGNSQQTASLKKMSVFKSCCQHLQSDSFDFDSCFPTMLSCSKCPTALCSANPRPKSLSNSFTTNPLACCPALFCPTALFCFEAIPLHPPFTPGGTQLPNFPQTHCHLCLPLPSQKKDGGSERPGVDVSQCEQPRFRNGPQWVSHAFELDFPLENFAATSPSFLHDSASNGCSSNQEEQIQSC